MTFQHIIEITRPTPKIPFLLVESQEHQQLGLGYFSEQFLKAVT